jgi:hypothetical protein
MQMDSSTGNGGQVELADKGSGVLFWGWIVVTLLNLGMVSASLALFAP